MLGPTRNMAHPVVDLESYLPAKSESLNSQSLQSMMLSPIKPLIMVSREELM